LENPEYIWPEFASRHEDTMDIHYPERRSASRLGHRGCRFDAATVRDGLAIQRHTNTRSAAEYLKAKGVDPSVIVRVLSSHSLRHDDVE
jgi:hypothetical protein